MENHVDLFQTDFLVLRCGHISESFLSVNTAILQNQLKHEWNLLWELFGPRAKLPNYVDSIKMTEFCWKAVNVTIPLQNSLCLQLKQPTMYKQISVHIYCTVTHLLRFGSRGRGTSRHFPVPHSSQYRRAEIHICRPTVLWEAEQEELV